MDRNALKAAGRKPGSAGISYLGMVIAVALLSSLLAGCAPSASGSPGVCIEPVPSAGSAELVLYFGDDQAMEIWPEFRIVEVPSDPSQRVSDAELVVQELLKGPQDTFLYRTLPPEAKLLSLAVTEGVALVNFSKEMQTKHWGGSAGESMTIASLVLSLTRLSGIDKVQILVEGKTIETLAGHFDMTNPLGSSPRTGEVFCSKERGEELQKRVDAGQEEWRKDPLQVAEREAGARGLQRGFTFKELPSTQGAATVEARDGDKIYLITLSQPEKQGKDGIWVISEIGPM